MKYILVLLLVISWSLEKINGQFENGHRFKVQASVNAGFPVGPSESSKLAGLPNYYNNYPLFVGFDINVCHKTNKSPLVAGLYISSYRYSNWNSPEGSTVYLGSSGNFKTLGIALFYDMKNGWEGQEKIHSLSAIVKVGITSINNKVIGTTNLLVEEYKVAVEGSTISMNLSPGLNFDFMVSNNISYYTQPGLDLYFLPGEMMSQNLLVLLRLNVGLCIYLDRPKNIY